MKTVQPKRDILLTKFGIAVTSLAALLFTREILLVAINQSHDASWVSILGDILFVSIVYYIIYGSFVYLVSRLGYLQRLKNHQPSSREEMETIYDDQAPFLTILVPSYKEEEHVVKQTLLSVAFQQYPKKRVVLLIDNPPFPKNREDKDMLEKARMLPSEITVLLEKPFKKFNNAQKNFIERNKQGSIDFRDEIRKIASLYSEAASWFDDYAVNYPVTDHNDSLFIDKIILGQRDSCLETVQKYEDLLRQDSPRIAENNILRSYQSLAALFNIEMMSFERKRYVNISHEPNKAMNLNSFISLMGKNFVEEKRNKGLYLVETDSKNADLQVPDSDYLITLDADSVLLPDYALRLIHIMERDENKKMAIIQTPYSAVPNSEKMERIAGATTDIQYIIHQGFTRHNATYWVGANALIRKNALDDIVSIDVERGFPIKRYIQDSTPIEDTESTIDLIKQGWKLHNYPERLSYSATPPDFGSLIIQRRRWANGGLNILPKLLKYIVARPHSLKKFPEIFLRFHYLTSLAAVNIGVLLLLFFPLSEKMFNMWFPICALPYFIFYAHDLMRSGYRGLDVFRVYALNLILIPVNICGVLKSLQQAFTGKKIPFGRTPKVQGRTAVAPLYIFLEYSILFHLVAGGLFNFWKGYYMHGFFALVNGCFFLYGIMSFIGIKESKIDFVTELSSRIKEKLEQRLPISIAAPEHSLHRIMKHVSSDIPKN